jgi:hypothetical protein
MSKYFLSVMIIVFVGGIVVSIAPDGSTKRYIRQLCGLAITLCILSPVLELARGGEGEFDKIRDLFDRDSVPEQSYAEIYNESILSAGAENASEILKNEIKQEFSLSDEAFDVDILAKYNGDEIYIDHIDVIIYFAGVAANPHNIKNYVWERFECECQIIYEL